MLWLKIAKLSAWSFYLLIMHLTLYVADDVLKVGVFCVWDDERRIQRLRVLSFANIIVKNEIADDTACFASFTIPQK